MTPAHHRADRLRIEDELGRTINSIVDELLSERDRAKLAMAAGEDGCARIVIDPLPVGDRRVLEKLLDIEIESRRIFPRGFCCLVICFNAECQISLI